MSSLGRGPEERTPPRLPAWGGPAPAPAPAVEAAPAERKGQAYWRSLDELAETEQFQRFVEREFPAFSEEMLGPGSRRSFLKLMGASVALAGLTACRWPREHVLPFARYPEGSLPGVPVPYATAMELGGVAYGLLASSFDGRPIKLEGNPDHPQSLGAATAWAQASVLELYDPDRTGGCREKTGAGAVERSWDEFVAFAGPHFTALKARGGEGLAFLTEATSSPTFAALKAQLLQLLPQVRFVEYEPLSWDSEREGLKLAFGAPHRAQLDFTHADLIVALDADPLFDHPAALRQAREFAARRRAPGGEMNRLYAVESGYSITGAMADHRFVVSPSRVQLTALHLAAALAGLPLPASAGAWRPEFLDRLMGELSAHRGKSLVVAGRQQPPAVHAAAALINAALGNTGVTVSYTADPEPARPAHAAALAALAEALRGGQVDTLVILGGNPVYNAPADLRLGEALSKVKTTIRLGLHRDETSDACHWHVPRAHYLESWGDARAWDGTLSVVQPLIEPLHGGKTPLELLALVLGTPDAHGHDAVRAHFAASSGAAGADAEWRKALHDGFVRGSAWPVVTPQPLDPRSNAALAAALAAPLQLADQSHLEVVFNADRSVYDGRFANSAWLQELPDPLTKLVWDNAALMGPKTAQALGIQHQDVVTLTAGGRSCDVAVYVLPAMPDFTVALPLGYGRTRAGGVGTDVGFNTYALRATDSMGFATGVTVRPAGRTYPLVSTQDHWAIDKTGYTEIQRRMPELIREASAAEYKAHPEFAKGEGEVSLIQLWDAHNYEGHRWGMAIDLTACIGCSACTIACQAENNIPIVGKEQVQKGREMQWLRIDRYFKGDPETAEVRFQPVTCQHCENAPCEQVCPVAATVHDSEGLNVMVYNRCIGTRYCSNNCPYKVRRFNFLNWHKHDERLQAMVYNPDVTVRSRGVMEKCTFCVHRIERVKIAHRNAEVGDHLGKSPIKDGEIVPACAQTCPTEAIVFGDLNDPESKVRQAHEHPRAYGLLAEYNFRPRNNYLARLNNPATGAAEASHKEHA